MVRKFGSLERFEQVKVAHRLMPRAREAGLHAEGWSDANLDRRRQSSTLRAHRLVLWIDRLQGWCVRVFVCASVHKSKVVRVCTKARPSFLGHSFYIQCGHTAAHTSREAAERVYQRLGAAHFTEGRLLNDVAVLLEAARVAGVPDAETEGESFFIKFFEMVGVMSLNVVVRDRNS
jgi:hypothetical protein